MIKWTWKLQLIDYNTGKESTVIKTGQSNFENVAYNDMVFNLPESVGIEGCELINQKTL
jgi:hypothetical protein